MEYGGHLKAKTKKFPPTYRFDGVKTFEDIRHVLDGIVTNFPDILTIIE